jgi:hypothetical protein
MLIRILQGERELAKGQLGARPHRSPLSSRPERQRPQSACSSASMPMASSTSSPATPPRTDTTLEIRGTAIDVEDERVEQMISESVDFAFDDMNERIWTEAKLKAEELTPRRRCRAHAARRFHQPAEESQNVRHHAAQVRQAPRIIRSRRQRPQSRHAAPRRRHPNPRRDADRPRHGGVTGPSRAGVRRNRRVGDLGVGRPFSPRNLLLQGPLSSFRPLPPPPRPKSRRLRETTARSRPSAAGFLRSAPSCALFSAPTPGLSGWFHGMTPPFRGATPWFHGMAASFRGMTPWFHGTTA